MRTTKVLLIESARSSGVSFATSLKRKYQVQIAHSGKQGMALALDKQPDVIVLDAASLRTSGDRICARLRANLDETPIIHIRPADSSPGVSIADVMLVPPFTARKLINRIERFTGPREGKLLKVGSFSLNQEQQTLVTPWSEKKLTPKVVALMELFMHNPNCILERKDIMQKVWKTDYIGDTRTLDVHIRWLRQVVEPNPRKPQYITTVRGKGYRFALPSSDNQTHAGESGQPSVKDGASKKPSARKPAASKPAGTAITRDAAGSSKDLESG